VRPLFLIALAAAVAIGALLSLGLTWWWLNRRFLLPLRKIAGVAQRLAAGDLADRVAKPEAEVLATLARSINHLATELEDQIGLRDTERD